MSDNHREFFRIDFDQLINGEILMHGGNSVHIVIENMGVGGLGFESSVDIPLHEKVECRFDILESPFLLEGSVVRKSRMAHSIKYGIGFEIDQDASSQLFKQLNYYQIRQKKGTPKG